MTSQKSFKNNFGFAYRTGLKSNIAVALIQFFIGALAFVYVPARSPLTLRQAKLKAIT